MDKEFKPYVPIESTMKELSFKAIILGVIMAAILGSANAYLGLKAGMTVAATFPAAVIAMAVLRVFKGTILVAKSECETTSKASWMNDPCLHLGADHRVAGGRDPGNESLSRM